MLLSTELIAFVREELRPSRRTVLGPDTRLLHDLHIDGADGWEFIAAFGDRFAVDLSDFTADLHFGPEAGPNLLYWLWWTLTANWPKHIPITLGDLEAAKTSGRWRTPARAAA